jgi:hypothetical protein
MSNPPGYPPQVTPPGHHAPQDVPSSPEHGAPSPLGPAPTDGRGPVRPEHFPGSMALDGRLPWVFGFLSLVGLPFLSLLAPGIAMIIAGLLQGRKNPVAARTGRRAAIFGAANVLVVVVYLVVLFLASMDGPVSPAEAPLLIYGFAIPAAVYLIAVGPIINVVMAILGLARPLSQDKARRILERAQR